MIASGEDSPEALSGFVKNSIHSIRFSRFPAGLRARRALRVPAWREDVYYGLPRRGSRESSDSAGFIAARGRIPQSRRGFPSSRNRYRGGLAASPCGGTSTTCL